MNHTSSRLKCTTEEINPFCEFIYNINEYVCYVNDAYFYFQDSNIFNILSKMAINDHT